MDRIAQFSELGVWDVLQIVERPQAEPPSPK
jgi:hypothetical protein